MMGEETKIEWAHHTFNPWWGCSKVSQGCAHCYAESFSKRTGNVVWGDAAPRRFFGDKHWAEPLKWNRDAEKSGERKRVFCASMADVFEDREDLVPHRARLWALIEATPWLDWLLLTKRIENVARLHHPVIERCWLGTTCENRKALIDRLPYLCQVRAAVRFLSCEPLLEDLDIQAHLWGTVPESWGYGYTNIMSLLHWVIVGGESGPGARSCNLSWIRAIVEQCREADVPVFCKQLGAKPVGDWSDVEPWPKSLSRKGDVMNEWPVDMRVRMFPEPFRMGP